MKKILPILLMAIIMQGCDTNSTYHSNIDELNHSDSTTIISLLDKKEQEMADSAVYCGFKGRKKDCSKYLDSLSFYVTIHGKFSLNK